MPGPWPRSMEETQVDKKLMQVFRNPGSDYRGAPFWAWNGKLEPEELRRQIRLMKEMGLGGFFMHSRVGLDTAYLAPEWFECVDACLDEAEKLDMNAWLYDEDRWPSGAAGGLVTRNPKYRMRTVRVTPLKTAGELKWTAETLAVFAARIDGVVARDVRRVPDRKKPVLQEGETLFHFEVAVQQPSPWYNGQTYLDTMNPEAVRAFIKVTHEAYRKRYRKHFGKRIPGIFTDEPNHGSKLGRDGNTGHPGGLPWTGKLAATFRKRYGYDLIPHLMELIYDVDGKAVSQARYHYHDCVTHLYVDAFCRQIGEWCEKHQLLFTGHQLEEDTLSSQTNMVGSCLRTYEYMQAPGMDLLTEHWRVFDTAKQVSSAANQFGRKWRLTETYGCTGWDFPLAGHKALGDWQAALGINLRCQHLAWYTMLAEAKRDYPAAIFYQSPWWTLYRQVEDYFARVNSVMTRGVEVRDLLVIHPVESMWLQCKTGWRGSPATSAANLTLISLSNTLLGAHLDFDYGDEELLSRHGAVVRKAGRPVMRVGKAEYRAVLVPSQVTMRRTTLEALRKFKAAGGEVVFAGEIAGHVDAVPSLDVKEFAATCVRTAASGEPVVKAVEAQARRLSIVDGDGREVAPALYLLREDKACFYLFICNTGEDFAAGDPNPMAQGMVRDRTLAYPEVRVRGFAGCAGKPVELDPVTGAEMDADAVRVAEGWEIRTGLPALGSRLFVIPKKEGGVAPVRPKAMASVREESLGGKGWNYRLSESNVLVLDRCRYKVGKGDWQPAQEILRVDDDIRIQMGVPKRGGGMMQPWARPAIENPRRVPVMLVYEFEVESLPSGDLFLALELPRTYRISVNGVRLSVEADAGWWTDLSLRRLPMDAMVLRPGRNEILLELDYAEDFAGLEIIYVLGAFGVTVEGVATRMTALPATLDLGDWCDQGLVFYAGHVAYTRTINPKRDASERVFVCVPEYRGVAVRVLVDGVEAGVAVWPPSEVEITSLLKDKPVELAIQVIGHRRNSHGPFHWSEKWPAWTGPGQYKYDPKHWFEGYQLVPCGLMQEPRLDVRK